MHNRSILFRVFNLRFTFYSTCQELIIPFNILIQKESWLISDDASIIVSMGDDGV